MKPTIFYIPLLLFFSCTGKQSSSSLLSKNNDSTKQLKTTEQRIDIPKAVSEKIILLNKYYPERIPQGSELKEIVPGEKYILYAKDKGCGEGYYTLYTFNSLDTSNDIWQFQTPECGSGGNVTKGSIMFTQNGVMEMSTYTSCSGAFDCKEYFTVLQNGKVVYEKKTDISN